MFLPEITETTRLVRRPLTAAEATLLHHELKTTPNILGYTPRELTAFTDVLVAEAIAADGEPVFAGIAICKHLLWNWTDIAVVYVLPDYRGRGIATHLFTSAFDAARERKRHVYTLSRSPQIIRLMKRLGMQIMPMNRPPLAVAVYNQRHMMSLYRWREAFRKLRHRMADGQRFVAGEYRCPPDAKA